MIVLIGGESCTGKTALAQRLLERHHVPYLSIDHIKMGLIRGWPECGIKATDADDAIAERLWPVLAGIIQTCIENGQHLILEGCYLPPERVRPLVDAFPRQILAVYIGLSAGYLERHFADGLLAYRNVIEARLWPETRSVAEIQAAHQWLKRRCTACDLSFFEIEADYRAEMQRVCDWMGQRMVEGGISVEM